MLVRLAAAAAELLRRRRARRSLAEYARSIEIPGSPLDPEDPECEAFRPIETALAQHHQLICDEVQRCIETHQGRLMLFFPPGAAKSTYATVVGTTWHMGKYPNSRSIITGYSADIAEKQSRRARSICRQKRFSSVWGAGLQADQRAVNEWAISNRSEMMAAGFLGGVGGNRADLIVIDDPVKNQEEADSDTDREKKYDEYINTILTRLKPGGSLILIMCMTGDTPVLMEDGTERALQQLRAGDTIAAYKDGSLASVKVINWVDQGLDDIFAITMESGITVRANREHPFLAERGGEKRWVKLKDLAVGDHLVKAVGASGGVSPVGRPGVRCPPKQKACAPPTTTDNVGLPGFGPLLLTLNRAVRHVFAIATGSSRQSSTPCLYRKVVSVQSAGNRQVIMFEPTGVESSASTTTTSPGASGDCSATTVTSLSATGNRPAHCAPQLSTFAITLDRVASIEPAGREHVFDIQVEGGNFVANGLISHNTRWHEDDLAGRILPEKYSGESGDVLCQDGKVWRVVNVPAKAEHQDDPLGRATGEYLWTAWFPQSHWAMWEHNPRARRTWAALCQQRPRPEEGIAFNRSDARWYDPTRLDLPPPGTVGYGSRDTPCGPPRSVRRFGASDYATLEEARADRSEHGVWGIDHGGRIIFEAWWTGQKETDKTIAAFIGLVQRFKSAPRSAHGIIRWWNEGGVIDKAVKPAINRAMRESVPNGSGFVPLDQLPSIKDKGTKLLSFHARYAAQSVYFPTTEAWSDDVIDQLVGFGAMRYDDKADVCGLAGRGIDQMGEEALPRDEVRVEGMKPFTRAWLFHEPAKQQTGSRWKA